MSDITFADVVHQSVSFSKNDPAEALLLNLIDTPWFQRLRDISQTANTRLVYMFSEHKFCKPDTLQKQKTNFTTARTRTVNLLLRRQAPYPLGHSGG